MKTERLRSYLLCLCVALIAGCATPPHATSITTGDKYLYADAPVAHGYPNSWTLLTNIGYESAYDEKFKNPAWVAYHLPGREGTPIDRPDSIYPTDLRTTSKVTAKDFPPGYDHGHMAPNYAISFYFGEEAQNETFLMSNMVAQRPGLNRGPWKSEETAEYVKWTAPGHDVWVICGPVYTTADDQAVTPTQHFGAKNVCIPVACFKIVMRVDQSNQVQTLAFIMPQDEAAGHAPKEYLTSIREIERRTGLNFFSSLKQLNQDAIELGVSAALWP